MDRQKRPGARPESRLIGALSHAERARIGPYLHETQLAMRQSLATFGEAIDHVVFPVTAVTSTLMQMPEGDSVEVGLMGAEGMVGLSLISGERVSTTTVMVQVPGWGYRMRTNDFVREVVLHGGELFRLLLRYSNVFLGMVAQVAGCNASHSVEQRLSRWLLLFHDRLQEPQFPMTHEVAALMLGVRRASVTETANSLRNVGAITYHSGVVTIVDRDRLEQSACGCYEVMRGLADSIFTTQPGEGQGSAGGN